MTESAEMMETAEAELKRAPINSPESKQAQTWCYNTMQQVLSIQCKHQKTVP